MTRHPHQRGYLSIGGWTVLAIAFVSSVLVLLVAVKRGERPEAVEVWTFARHHESTYTPLIERWNDEAAETGAHLPAEFFVIDGQAIVRRTLSAAWAGTPVADVIEVERGQVGFFFTGPLENIPFVDLTPYIERDGLQDTFLPTSYSLWSTQGRIYGLPHDVHPVVLAYRHDILEDEYGITPEQFEASIETWEDFVRVTKPLIKDLDGDGQLDRYPLSMWTTERDQVELLLLQAGGGAFLADGTPALNRAVNARVLAQVVAWCYGPDRVARHAPDFDQSGNERRLRGEVLCVIMPDWLAGVYRNDLPALEGKWRIMPLPAWEPGGRRTSVRGGTMLSITTRAVDEGRFEEAWAFAQELYVSEELAEALWTSNRILTPARDMWDKPWYHEPDPYFDGQVSGELFIELTDQVPARVPSPFRNLAMDRIGQVVTRLESFATSNNTYDLESLAAEAMRLLDDAQARMEQDISQNVFLREGAGTGDAGDTGGE